MFPDRRAELLGRSKLSAARLALDGEDGSEESAAGRTAIPHLSAARRADARQLGLVLLEVALRMTAAEAERDPVAQRLSPLLS